MHYGNLVPPSPGDPTPDQAGYGGGGAPPGDPTGFNPADWVNRARWCHDDGDQWLEQARRQPWEKSIRQFRSEHPSDSKYHSKDYQARSRLFRPKTRAAVMRQEANTAAAFFTTEEVLSLKAIDDSDPMQLANAEIWQHVIQHRLRTSVPWFKVVVGARQDAEVLGVCISKQYWRYEKDGRGKVTFDQPWIQPIAPENFRVSPACDWLDPVNSSPYLVNKVPMFYGDVRARMQIADRTGAPQWMWLDDGTLMKAREVTWDRTRQVREGRGQDPKSISAALREHDIIWMHENFIRIGNIDWYYWTAGVHGLVTMPVPADEVHQPFGGERPFAMGVSVIEAHRVYPSSRVELFKDLQTEVNEVTNQRMDNVRLSMNGRNFVKAGRDVDIAALQKSTPGGIVMMQDPKTDVIADRPQDVTASSYEEQDRLFVEFDELAGLFSPSSVQSNRKLNETVGGMNLMASGAQGAGEYQLRVFTETWVLIVLRQIVKLEQAYETDLTLIATAAGKSQTLMRFGITEIGDEMLTQGLLAEVNVGMAATNPETRLQKFITAATAVGQLVGPLIAQRIDPDAIADEIFGHAGYRSSRRFIRPMMPGMGMGMPGMPGQPGMPGSGGMPMGPGGAPGMPMQAGPNGPQQMQPPMDPAMAEAFMKQALAEHELQSKIDRENRMADAAMERESRMLQHRTDLDLAKEFNRGGAPAAEGGTGGGRAAGAEGGGGGGAIMPAQARGAIDRLNTLFEGADQMGKALQVLLRTEEQTQNAVKAIAEATQQLAQSQQVLANQLNNGRAMDGRRAQRLEQRLDDVMAYLTAPTEVVLGPDGQPTGTRKVLANGRAIEKRATFGANGQVTGLQ